MNIVEETMERKIKEALKEIQRGSFEIIDIQTIEKLLKNYYENGKNFFIKAGSHVIRPFFSNFHQLLLI